MAGLIDRIKPKFQSNLHSFGEWLLYPQGWQVGTLDADYPIYVALGGTDGASPAIPGFNPGQSADTLYVTNGETTDYADTSAGTIAYTPELGEGIPGAGFVFPDDEALIQAEFEKTLPFHLGLARSAPHPATPDSPVGIGVEPFYLDADDIDPQNGQQSLFDFKFGVSYGDPQEVRVLAKRSLGAVTLRYQVNGGPVQQRLDERVDRRRALRPRQRRPTTTWSAATVTGTAPGDSVKVWFTGGGATSDSFTYRVESDTGRRVLVLAAEDYTGASPAKPGVTAPHYLSFYTDALTANGVAFDVYDVDAHGRTAPDNLGVLEPLRRRRLVHGRRRRDPRARLGRRATRRGWRCRSCSRCATSSTRAGACSTPASAPGSSTRRRSARSCTTRSRTASAAPIPAVAGALPGAVGLGRLAGRPDRVHVRCGDHDGRTAGCDPDTGDPFDVAGIDDPLAGLTWGFNGADSAQNQASNSSFIATGDFLQVTDPADSFPQFESWPAAEYLSGLSGPFDPHTGQSFMWSDRADEAYKRLTRTITVPAGGATLSFWTSYNLELDFDYMIVEAHTVGQDDWTTLPDLNGHTSSDLSNDQSCTGGWSNPADAANVLHPFLTHYQTFDPATGTCSSTGTQRRRGTPRTAARAAGSSSRSTSRPFAGRQVEVSITVAERLGPAAVPRRVHRRHRGLDR